MPNPGHGVGVPRCFSFYDNNIATTPHPDTWVGIMGCKAGKGELCGEVDLSTGGVGPAEAGHKMLQTETGIINT